MCSSALTLPSPRCQTLAKLQTTWTSIEFEFEQHRGSDVHLLKMKEEDFEALEDNQLVVQGMMASKYLERSSRTRARLLLLLLLLRAACCVLRAACCSRLGRTLHMAGTSPRSRRR